MNYNLVCYTISPSPDQANRVGSRWAVSWQIPISSTSPHVGNSRGKGPRSSSNPVSPYRAAGDILLIPDNRDHTLTRELLAGMRKIRWSFGILRVRSVIVDWHNRLSDKVVSVFLS